MSSKSMSAVLVAGLAIGVVALCSGQGCVTAADLQGELAQSDVNVTVEVKNENHNGNDNENTNTDTTNTGTDEPPPCPMPQVSAGVDQTVASGSNVMLDGSVTASGSYTFAWTQTSGLGVVLANASSLVTEFMAPPVSTDTVLVFQLTVTNTCGMSANSTVAVTVQAAPDSDGDGTPDAQDGCPGDPAKVAPGACGCGRPDSDSDSDGAMDCSDACPQDPNKTEPGECGCGVPESECRPVDTDVTVSAAWEDAVDSVNVDIDWWLPGGSKYANVNRTSWAKTGVESFSVPGTAIVDGCHILGLTVNGTDKGSDVSYSVSFLGFTQANQEYMWGPDKRFIALDVENGLPIAVFNSWYASYDPGYAVLTGRQLVEVQAAWGNADDNVNVDISLKTPSGRKVERAVSWDWALVGFERLVIPAGQRVEDGIYRLEVLLNGNGQMAEVTYQVQFLNSAYEFSFQDYMWGGDKYVIELEVSGGEVTEVSNTYWYPE